SAKVKLYRTLALNKNQNVTFDQTSIAHHPELKYYSADGKLVVFTDHGAKIYRESLRNKERVLVEKMERTYQVLMLLEDGFWRIRHMVEMAPEKLLRVQDTVLEKSGDPASIKGINYYPKDAPWAMFGQKFNDSIINADFKIIKDMGLNTVRLFINYEEFGKNKLRKDKMKKMKKVLDLAQAHQLKAIITLFDFYGNYDVYDWTLTHRHAEKVVKALKKHPALLGWDLKNEPDLDFESRGKHTVLAWLSEMNTQIKKWDPVHPITIGWSNTQAAVHLANELDYVSFHYYEDLDLFPERMAALRKAVPNRQLVLQEYGLSSYSGPWNGFSGSDENQAEYYREIQAQLKKEKLPFLFWTLYDFEEVPNRVAGWQPWRKNKQGFFGCIDVNGNKKEAYFQLLQSPKNERKEKE
ncbi:MAG: cellulase family glycosylhydrolase, partial [Flavobacteriaceae bacterium]